MQHVQQQLSKMMIRPLEEPHPVGGGVIWKERGLSLHPFITMSFITACVITWNLDIDNVLVWVLLCHKVIMNWLKILFESLLPPRPVYSVSRSKRFHHWCYNFFFFFQQLALKSSLLSIGKNLENHHLWTINLKSLVFSLDVFMLMSDREDLTLKTTKVFTAL